MINRNIKNRSLFLQIQEQIEKAENILITTHQSADGDALGSVTAMAEYLDIIGKNYNIFCSGDFSVKYSFLKNYYKIKSDKIFLSSASFDLIIILDCSSLDYTGIGSYLDNFKQFDSKIINIDHHIANNMYGDINIVEPEASATGAVIYNYFKFIGFNINSDIATCLLTGILTDTENFSNGATNRDSLDIAAELMNLSAGYRKVVRNVYEDESHKSLQIWGRVLSRLKKNDKIKVAYSVVFLSDIEASGSDTVDGISNFLNNIGEVDFVMVLKEVGDGNIKVSLRSTGDRVDVLPLALLFNGGGHAKAAGFFVRGRLEQIGNYWQIL